MVVRSRTKTIFEGKLIVSVVDLIADLTEIILFESPALEKALSDSSFGFFERARRVCLYVRPTRLPV